MKKETIYLTLLLFVAIAILSFLLGRVVKQNKDLRDKGNQLIFILKEDSLLKKDNENLKIKYVKDSIDFAQKVKEVNTVVKIKYKVIKEGLEKMTPEQSVGYFYERTINCKPDSIEFKGDSTVLPNSSIKSANLIFIERDFYKEKSDTLDSAVGLARLALLSQIDLGKNKDKVIENQQNKIDAAITKLNSVESENSILNKKLKRTRKIAVGSSVGLIGLTSLLILL